MTMAMLKLLLVGFTEQNANVIQMFIELTFDNIRVMSVPRLPEGTSPRLPDLTVFESDSDMFIIDAESIGFDFANYQNACQTLETALPNKAMLLITRQALSDEVVANVPKNLQWLSIPYTRNQMAEKLQLLISDAQRKQQPMADSQPIVDTPNPTTNMASQESESAQVLQTNQPVVTANIDVAEIEHSNALFNLLNKNFRNLRNSAFFEFAQTLYQLETYTVFNINGHYLFINPFDKSVIASRIERIIDHFMIGQNLRQSLINRQTLDQIRYEQQSQQHIVAGNKKLALSQLIWHIGLEMLPRNAFDDTHTLAIEVRFMPNLAGINFVPNYVMPLIASCLGRVRTLTELHQLFPTLTNAQVNQVIILLVMSHSVNAEVLLANRPSNEQRIDLPLRTPTSLTQSSEPSQEPSIHNQGIKKAQQTGFLKRLLGKLGVNV